MGEPEEKQPPVELIELDDGTVYPRPSLPEHRKPWTETPVAKTRRPQ